MGLFLIALFALLIKTFWIQIIHGQMYAQKAFEQHNSQRIITPSRGTILDRNGHELAVSASAERISINPMELRRTHGEEGKLEYLAIELARILELESEEVLKKLNRASRYETLKRRVDKNIGDKIRKLISKENLTAVNVDEDSKRFYPNAALGSHVIGFTGNDDQGLYGIEFVMDEYLKGKEGRILSERDVLGRPIPFSEERRFPATPGKDVVLTIDETIQHIVEKEIERAIIDSNVVSGAAVLVMEPHTGDILAMASKPDFNPNDPKAAPPGIEPESWSGNTSDDINTLESTVWRNKVLMDSYEPGSTFKTFTTAMGLEERVIDIMTPSNDRTINVAGHNINCWKPNAHGTQPFYRAVYTSCNPVFVKVAQKLGISKFYQYMRAFGFYEPTEIVLPGETNSIHHRSPTEIDMATASFGQRFQVTPLQIVSAYSAVVNGGNLMTPRLIKELRDENGTVVQSFEPELKRVAISKSTSDQARDILEGTVSEGTGRNAYVQGYRVAGKTGTSETLETPTIGRYIASFAGFAPADDPKIVVLVVLDNPQGGAYYGGTVAAPVAGRIFEQTLNYLGVERIYTEEDRKNMAAEVYVPDVREKPINEARKILKDAGLNMEIANDDMGDEFVYSQIPMPGVFVSKDSLILVYTKEEVVEVLIEVPNVEGYGIQDATYILRRNGFNIRVFGVGNSYRQSVQAGNMMPKGSVIEVDFKSLDTH